MENSILINSDGSMQFANFFVPILFVRIKLQMLLITSDSSRRVFFLSLSPSMDVRNDEGPSCKTLVLDHNVNR